jgi:hypothetical protein
MCSRGSTERRSFLPVAPPEDPCDTAGPGPHVCQHSGVGRSERTPLSGPNGEPDIPLRNDSFANVRALAISIKSCGMRPSVRRF